MRILSGISKVGCAGKNTLHNNHWRVLGFESDDHQPSTWCPTSKLTIAYVSGDPFVHGSKISLVPNMVVTHKFLN